MKDDQVARVHQRLAARPELRRVGLGERRRFGLWELASLAEAAFGECVDPDSLTGAGEKRWRLRLGPALRLGAHRQDDSRVRYWIRSPEGGRDGEPLGTVAVGTWLPYGVGALHVTSLYVHPVARRRGLASAVLDLVYDACRAEGLHGFRLGTQGTWRETVRHHLRRGLWVTSWRESPGFARLSYLPRYEVEESGEGELALLVAGAGGRLVPVLFAGRAGGRLCLRESAEYRRTPDRIDAVRLYARPTLVLHLAVREGPSGNSDAVPSLTPDDRKAVRRPPQEPT
ncbi:GNAT family N-acetyltransferase [Streptomyces sp. SID13726]|uniref:GNAT family N-acetyltransferase n=1 Tax=Streptomyces sp. SID13726 TaxID=2706058 RepID=UPI0013B5B98C|nr:GNAT family N-acetyltransferase [Streptomyces sp. SID13726]NEB01531.1 GNAT family N-acetyltransferase [Streptomyces sp. SID13726]